MPHGQFSLNSGHFLTWHAVIDDHFVYVARAPYEREWRATVNLDPSGNAAVIGTGRSAPAAVRAAFDLLAVFKPVAPAAPGSDDADDWLTELDNLA